MRKCLRREVISSGVRAGVAAVQLVVRIAAARSKPSGGLLLDVGSDVGVGALAVEGAGGGVVRNPLVRTCSTARSWVSTVVKRLGSEMPSLALARAANFVMSCVLRSTAAITRFTSEYKPCIKVSMSLVETSVGASSCTAGRALAGEGLAGVLCIVLHAWKSLTSG